MSNDSSYNFLEAQKEFQHFYTDFLNEKKKEGSNIGIMHVESLKNELSDDYKEQKNEVVKHNKLFEIWLAGTPYNEK